MHDDLTLALVRVHDLVSVRVAVFVLLHDDARSILQMRTDNQMRGPRRDRRSPRTGKGRHLQIERAEVLKAQRKLGGVVDRARFFIRAVFAVRGIKRFAVEPVGGIRHCLNRELVPEFFGFFAHRCYDSPVHAPVVRFNRPARNGDGEFKRFLLDPDCFGRQVLELPVAEPFAHPGKLFDVRKLNRVVSDVALDHDQIAVKRFVAFHPGFEFEVERDSHRVKIFSVQFHLLKPFLILSCDGLINAVMIVIRLCICVAGDNPYALIVDLEHFARRDFVGGGFGYGLIVGGVNRRADIRVRDPGRAERKTSPLDVDVFADFSGMLRNADDDQPCGICGGNRLAGRIESDQRPRVNLCRRNRCAELRNPFAGIPVCRKCRHDQAPFFSLR